MPGIACGPLDLDSPAASRRAPAPGDSGALVLRADAAGLALVAGGMELRGDLSRMLPRLRPENLRREMLVRAARIKGAAGAPRAVDATAGLGEDSLLLAAAGFEVTLFERDAVIAALLRDSLRRAAQMPALAPIVARMHLREADSVAALREMAAGADKHETGDPVSAAPRETAAGREAGDLVASAGLPDLVLLDPMFPERRKSASVKKKLQLLQRLEQPCDDEAELLAAARAAAARKVVVKRPAKGPFLAGAHPSSSVAGKAVRYDVYVAPPRG